VNIKNQYTSLLPGLPQSELEALRASISSQGVRVPVVKDQDGNTIDGHHREAIADELGIECPVEVRAYESEVAKRADALAMNLARRNLTSEQRLEVRKHQQSVYLELRQGGLTQAQAAAMVGIARRTGSDWEANTTNGGPAKGSRAKPPDKREKLTAAEREEVARRTDAGEPQQQIADDLGITQQRVSRISQQAAKKRAQDEERARNEEKLAAVPSLENLANLDARFSTVVIDPPWPMKKIERDERPIQSESLDYPTMSEEELSRLFIPAATDAHLYMWTTHKFLPMALRLADIWGFNYQCLLTWVKNVGFTPYSFMYSTEHVLFARRGSLDLLQKGKRLDFSAKVREHSRKPDVFYDLVRTVSPGPRIDMFAREKRDGFEVWGNEPERFADAA
jgi:N6-adenosine-specific RNA methylase IME4/predicted XRE-type DNA-binding protein